ALVQQQRVDAGRVTCDQVGADLALIDGGGHDGPGPDDAPAQVSANRQAEAVEPFGVRAVAAEPGGQVVAGAGPAVRAADPGGVLDRDGGGVDLLDRVGGHGRRPGGAELLEGAPQPAGAAVDLRLVRQVREQVRPVAADLGQEPALATAAEQVPDQRDREQFSVCAGRSGTGTTRDQQRARLDGVINQAVDVDEQQLSCQHGGDSCGGGKSDNCLLPQESSQIKHHARRVATFNSNNAPQRKLGPLTPLRVCPVPAAPRSTRRR